LAAALPLASPTSNPDVALLLTKVKPALQGQRPNAQLATWNASTPLCLWRGLRWAMPDGRPLRCNAASSSRNLSLASDPALLLVSIRLPAAALAGHLPPDFGAFFALDSVYLAANALSGPVPLELVNVSSLSALDLAGNRLDGDLPTSIWNLCDRVTELRLHGNALTGAVPAPAGPNTTCDRLSVLDLGANRFSGGFPAFLTAFRGLGVCGPPLRQCVTASGLSSHGVAGDGHRPHGRGQRQRGGQAEEGEGEERREKGGGAHRG